MVVLTIVTQKNGETVFLDQAIPQVHFMKLISCSLYNSWDTLKKRCVATLEESAFNNVTRYMQTGHYNLDTLVEVINNLFSEKKPLKVSINTPQALLEIRNKKEAKITFSQHFGNLLGVDGALEKITYVNRLKIPSAYFIHCDLIDRDNNFFNNKKTDLLAKINVKGKPYENVTYDASPQQPFRDC